MLNKFIQKNYSSVIKDKITNSQSYKASNKNIQFYIDYLLANPNNPNYKDYIKYKQSKLCYHNTLK